MIISQQILITFSFNRPRRIWHPPLLLLVVVVCIVEHTWSMHAHGIDLCDGRDRTSGEPGEEMIATSRSKHARMKKNT